jgi:putative oxidoreductase
VKYAVIVARVLLGLGFVVFGANILHPFLPMPKIDPDSPTGKYMALMAVGDVHYMTVVGLLQFIGGALVLSGYLVPLGLTLLGPVIVNIILYHTFIDHTPNAPEFVVAILEIFLIYAYWPNFQRVFELKPAPKV